ncbi:MAG: sigma-70 family RNA polymerase sigma factor [Lachnospiraceae bacterium]
MLELMEMDRKDGLNYEEMIAGLYREYATGILRMCYLYLGDYQLAEDAMQETFVKVFRHYEKFHGESEVKTWITRIAINCCKDFLAELKTKHSLFMSDEECKIQLGEKSENRDKSAYSVTEDRMVLSHAIGKLEDKYREVVVLFYYQELSTKEIAQITNIPRTTVEFRLKRAREILKNDLRGARFDGKLEESAGY